MSSACATSSRRPFPSSGGEKKRIAIASVLCMKPQILVLDEPTNSLDPQGAQTLVALLNKLNRELGVTLIFATHDVDITPLLADRVVFIERGAIKFSGLPAEAFRQKGAAATAGPSAAPYRRTGRNSDARRIFAARPPSAQRRRGKGNVSARLARRRPANPIGADKRKRLEFRKPPRALP